MQTIKLYCHVCKKHTQHVDLPMEYATACTVCGTHTPTLMRLQAEQSLPEDMLVTPDGNSAVVVENGPTIVTFYVPNGSNAGYYEYNKATGQRTIRK